MTEIATNLAQLYQQIEMACQGCGRDPETVRLIAVSKKKPPVAIEEAFSAGQRLFGESYVQEFSQKQAEVALPVDWHFIGGLQSNKVKYLRGKTALIHSVDRLSLAREISQQWGKIGETAAILLQVNLGGETTKSGTNEANALALTQQVNALPNVKICGLMTLPPYRENPEDVRPFFRSLRLLRDKLAAAGIPDLTLPELSMGMSHDYKVAIEEGATLIRVGTAIFGARD